MILAYISVKRKQKVNPYGSRQHASVVLQKREILPISIHMLRRVRAPVYLRREAGMRGRMALNT